MLSLFFKSADTAGRIAEKSLPTEATRAEMDKRKFEKQTEKEFKRAFRAQRTWLGLAWNKNIAIDDRVELIYGNTWEEDDKALLKRQLHDALPKHK
jgi:hypothetical protein